MHESSGQRGKAIQYKGWHADRPMLTKPETFGTKLIGGVLHYTGTGNKLYVASLFDKMFKTPGGKVKSRFGKQKSVDSRVIND